MMEVALIEAGKVLVLIHDFEGILFDDPPATTAYVEAFPTFYRYHLIAVFIAREETVEVGTVAA